MRRPLAAVLVAGVVGASALAAPAGVGGASASASTTTAPSACTVSGASLTWGFKESFRSYISGSIAKGKWEVADGATYTIPSFGWANGEGDLAAGKGAVQYTGSIRFTGHEGVLDTTVANPALVFDGTSAAVLLLDVTGETQEGVAIQEKAVPFADVALASVDPALAEGGTVTLAAAATTLTAEGAAAFGSYEAGIALDPIDAVLAVSCPTPTPTPTPPPTPTPTPTPAAVDAAGAATPTALAEATTSGAGPTAGYLGGGVALAAIAVASAAYLVVRRRRRVPEVPDDTTPGGTA